MSAVAEVSAPVGPRLKTESVRGALLWLLAFSGGFVFIEPGPYEVVGLATLFFFIVTGTDAAAGARAAAAAAGAAQYRLRHLLRAGDRQA